jgi:N6-L-threonylcarbamoyladenine synthase
MRILGIETSCDETAAAVVEDGNTLLSNVIHSQIDIHKIYGGVVPEIAARSHIEIILPAIQSALEKSESNWEDIDAIAVTYGPGLVGSLLIGTLSARTLALIKHKPLYPIHHVKAHVYASFLGNNSPKFPLLSLIVSGGHSQLVLFENHQNYKILGQTQDDAIGEAFDKVAKIIGLPYPGGPSIASAAENGDPTAYKFPKAKLKNPLDFSFSGLKTAVLRRVQAECGVDYNFPSFKLADKLDEQTRSNFAASFQKVAVETLVDKLQLATEKHHPSSIVIAGGVAANKQLRKVAEERLSTEVIYPDFSLCTDNAAMIASLAYFQSKFEKPANPRHLEVSPSISM